MSSKTATTHIFQSGVRNWPTSVSRREIEVFNPQARDSRLRRESWQVYADEGSQSSSSKKRPKKSGLETMLYLESKAEKEFDLRKEIRIKKAEMGLQKELRLKTK